VGGFRAAVSRAARSALPPRAAALTAAASAVAAAAVAAQLASPPTAGAGARACPSFAVMKTFAGTATLRFKQAATGTIPGTQHTETIQLSRLVHLGVTSTHKINVSFPGVGPVTLFRGVTNPRGVTIDDTVTISKPFRVGHAKEAGAPENGSAILVLNPQSCGYRLALEFHGRISLSGHSPKVPRAVSGFALTPERGIPKSLPLTLSGSAPLDAYHDGCTFHDALNGSPAAAGGCYGFAGGFAVDFEMLFRCHSISDTGYCASGDKPVGVATISWSLTESS
jgi:hypothetical protein